MLQFSQERAVLIDNVHQALSQPVAVLAVQVPVAAGGKIQQKLQAPLFSKTHFLHHHAFDLTPPALQSPHGFLPSPLSCAGSVQSIDTRDATRAVTAALLETVWGAAGPHVTWNSGVQAMEEDHLWSVSPTPWATLHSGLRLPFHVKDAAQRAVVYNEISAVIEALAPLQNLMRRVNVPLGSLLKVAAAARMSSCSCHDTCLSGISCRCSRSGLQH